MNTRADGLWWAFLLAVLLFCVGLFISFWVSFAAVVLAIIVCGLLLTEWLEWMSGFK